MIQLKVENVLEGKNLLLENGDAVFCIENNMLKVEVTFPASYQLEEYSEEDIGKPKDYWFKSSASKLELELPLEDENIFGKEFFVDSEDEDNEDLTNFLIAGTHYPTFDDRMIIKEENKKYLLNWTGQLPDIKNSRYEVYMKNMFSFHLQGEIEKEKIKQ